MKTSDWDDPEIRVIGRRYAALLCLLPRIVNVFSFTSIERSAALDVLERGERQVLADEITSQVHRGLSADPPAYFQSAAALRAGGGPSAG
jgi:hypothetical protein